jgi:hypothetical protein
MLDKPGLKSSFEDSTDGRNYPKHQRFFTAEELLRTWHRGCSLFGASIPLKEQQMKLLLATMFRKVPVRNTQRRATICKRCGARIYSLSFLKAHLEAHDKKTH